MTKGPSTRERWGLPDLALPLLVLLLGLAITYINSRFGWRLIEGDSISLTRSSQTVYEEGTINFLVQRRLTEMAERIKEYRE